MGYFVIFRVKVKRDDLLLSAISSFETVVSVNDKKACDKSVNTHVLSEMLDKIRSSFSVSLRATAI